MDLRECYRKKYSYLKKKSSRRIVFLDDRIMFPVIGIEVVFYYSIFRDVNIMSASLKEDKDAIKNIEWRGEYLPLEEFYFLRDGTDYFVLAHCGLSVIVVIDLYAKKISVINKVIFFKPYSTGCCSRYWEAIKDKRNKTIDLGASWVGVYRTEEDFDEGLDIKILSLQE